MSPSRIATDASCGDYDPRTICRGTAPILTAPAFSSTVPPGLCHQSDVKPHCLPISRHAFCLNLSIRAPGLRAFITLVSDRLTKSRITRSDRKCSGNQHHGPASVGDASVSSIFRYVDGVGVHVFGRTGLWPVEAEAFSALPPPLGKALFRAVDTSSALQVTPGSA